MEGPVAFSQAPCWDELRQLYAAAGMAAWDQGLPFHITCNPHIAEGCARLVIDFVQDLVDAGAWNPQAPVYVLELGAGTGKFGFHFLHRLQVLRQQQGLERVRIVHVMSDVAPANIAHWRCQPGLRDPLERGELELAAFDLARDATLRLLDSQGATRCEIAVFDNPLVVVAHYVLDSLPQDAFRVAGGRLQEMQLQSWPAGARPVDLAWTPQPLPTRRYPDDEAAQQVLQAAAAAGPDRHFCFPVAACAGLRRLAHAARGRMCVLLADLDASGHPASQEPPQIAQVAPRGFFYLPVDLGLVEGYLQQLGARLTRHRPAQTLGCCAAVLGLEPDALPRTQRALDGFVLGPGQRSAINTLLERAGRALPPEEWLALATWLCDDPALLDASVDTVRGWAATLAPGQPLRQELLATLQRMRRQVYWVPGNTDSWFTIAMVLQEMGEFEAALQAYHDSLATVGVAADAHFNIGLCERALGRPAAALQDLAQALALDPGHVLARGWMAQIGLETAAAGAE